MKNIYIKSCCVLFAAFLVSAAKALGQEKSDTLVNVAFRTVAKEDLLGGVSTVNVSDLLKKNYSTNSLGNLQSLIGGYANNNIWGQAALVLIDGVPRRAADVRLTEVESITVLKSADAVALYGSNGSKGAILITTKRGSIGALKIDVRANTGLFIPKSYPKYLNAADYKTFYNEALANDGITTGGYPQAEIDITRAGTSPFRYADIDFFSSDYLKKTYSRSDITTEIAGGNEFARYYTNIGLNSNNSLVNYGEQKKNRDFGFNVRGNVDMNISKWLTASANAVANLNDNYVGRGDFWGASATIPPNFNRFSPLFPIDAIDVNSPNYNQIIEIARNSNHIIDGQYLLGALSNVRTNVFSDMLAAGYIKTKSRTFLYNINAKADLGVLTKGLSFTTGTSLDYNSVYSEAYLLEYATYEPIWTTVNGRDVITDFGGPQQGVKQYGIDRNSIVENVGRSVYTQTMSFKSQFNYGRTFANDHNVAATLMGWWFTSQNSGDINNGGGTYQPLKNTNLGFQAGYNFRKKYYLDFSGALVHSAKLPPSKRNGISPTVTAGWRLSDEGFFKKNLSFFNNLKLTSSYASLKQDLDITGTRFGATGAVDYYLYETFFTNRTPTAGYYQWRDGAAGAGGNTTRSVGGGNPDLTFVKRNEFRVGLEGSMSKNLITFDANYFSQITDGLLAQQGSDPFPSYFTGQGDFRPWLNYGKQKRTGVDFALNLNKKIGEVQYSLGMTGLFYNSKILRLNETPTETYLARTNRPLDNFFGYVAEGLFQNQAEITNSPAQQFGGTLRPGDIKYKDINGDGVINDRDQIDLGHNGFASSPFNYGVNVTVKWKRLTMFALGSGNAGAIAFKSGSYYWPSATGKYSVEVLNRWTPATAASATYPRLSTNSTANNYRNSTYWMYKTNRFNLDRVQFTYDFNDDILKKSFVHGLSIYVQGDNLLVVAKERRLLETNIGSPPQTRFLNLGVRTSF
ncbi:SusC/RagA family TonB-linked outer membrane protein [Mucilaginibacter terrae]|uniref:SusC/RagA family TonB-linked outer membrane protein n=1 Tax=Mucilaginibacter terrae TaxID=1955052 RepID=UPI00362B600C